MVLEKYKEDMTRMIQMMYPVSKEELEPVLDYSISKRYKEYNSHLVNTYTNKTSSQTLLQSDRRQKWKRFGRTSQRE